MTAPHEPGALTRLATLAAAEFRKIGASRVPLAFLLAIPALTYVFVFELYHVEHADQHLHGRNAGDVLPLLYFSTTRTLLFQAAVVAFAAFWATVDSQYGMIRVACAQPLGRVEYLIAKWCGILCHVLLFSMALIASHVAWPALYSGVGGMDAGAWLPVARFSLESLLFTAALAVVAMATASCRRTVGAGLVTAVLAVIGLALMTLVPWDVLAPRFVFMRYFFFPLGEFPNPFQGDSPFVRVHSMRDFLTTVLATPAVLAAFAVAYFARRDITE